MLALASLIAASCSSPEAVETTEPSPTTSASAPEALASTVGVPEMTTVRIAAPASILATPVWIANEEGYFGDVGIELEIVGSSNDPQTALALLHAGDTDLIVASLYDVALDRFVENNDVAVTSQLYGAGSGRMFRGESGTLRLHTLPDNDIDHPCDLEGAVIGVPAGKSLLSLGVQRWIADTGCNGNDITLTGYGEGERLSALIAGEIDGAAFIEPWSNEALRSGATNVFDLDGNLCSDCAVGVVASTSAWGNDNLEVVAQFNSALERAMAIAQDDEISFRAQLVQCCAISIDDASAISIPSWTPTTENLGPAVSDLFSVMQQKDLLPAGIDHSEVLLNAQ